MTTGTSASASLDRRSLAASLAPALKEACGGRIDDIAWFKADWQRGGAATATAKYLTEARERVPVIVKMPVVRRELIWLRRLQQEDGSADGASPVVPRLYAFGDAIGDYDLTWVVMERFAHGPLGMRWRDEHVARIAEAAARFHRAAGAFEIDQPPRDEPWDDLVREAVDAVRVNVLPEEARWTKALKAFRERLPALAAEWRARQPIEWLHGDLHLANAMSRVGIDDGPVALIDLAEVHAGHWLEDAVYLERQLWTRPDIVKSCRPVRAVALARKAIGLPVDEGYARLAMVRRGLLAATAPRFLRSEGSPRHLAGCLEWLEKALAEL